MSTELTTLSNQDIALIENGLSITGLEGVPTSMVRMPSIRLVQPVSQNTTLVNGKDATPGNFYYDALQKEKGELHVALITAKKKTTEYENAQGVLEPRTSLMMLVYDLEEGQPHFMRISPTSFTGWGKLLAQMTAQKVDAAWDREITITSEKIEGEKGKYYVAKFTLGEKFDDIIYNQMTDLYKQVGNYFSTDESELEETA